MPLRIPKCRLSLLSREASFARKELVASSKQTLRGFVAHSGPLQAAWHQRQIQETSTRRRPQRDFQHGPNRDVSVRIRDSSAIDWEDPSFWDDIIKSNATRLPTSVRLSKAFQKITTSPDVPGSFLLECPAAFNAVLDGSLEQDDQTSGHLRHELCQYIFRQYTLTKARPPADAQTYSKIIGSVLQLRPNSARLYHQYLAHVDFSGEELASLVVRIAHNAAATNQFQQFCATLPAMRSSYQQIISQLCKVGLYDEAFDWHTFLVENGCSPLDALHAEPLRAHLSDTQQEANLAALDQTVRKATLQGFVNYLEDVFPQGKKSAGEFSDSTLARGLATTFISIDTAIKGLELFGVRVLGPLALRQLVLRTTGESECDLGQLKQLLLQLRHLKIKIEDCAFSRLVQKLLREENAEMLQDVVSCDLHCDVFGDTDLQVSLLAKFEAAMDQQGIERTMAILLTDVSKEHEQAQKLNFNLRSCLIRDDHPRLEQLVEQTLAGYTPVDVQCLRLMHGIVSKGFVTEDAHAGIDADLIVKIWLRLLDYDNSIPESYWKTALKGLLTAGYLSQYDTTALSLTRWYLGKSSSNESGYKAQNLRAPASSDPARVASQPRRGNKASLTYIFSMNHLTDVIAFGFFHGRQQDPDGVCFAKEATTFGRAVALAAHPMLWGLRTVLLLEARGVRIDRELSLQRFQSYVKALCGPGIHLRDQSSVALLPGTSFDDYMEAQKILIDRIAPPRREENVMSNSTVSQSRHLPN